MHTLNLLPQAITLIISRAIHCPKLYCVNSYRLYLYLFVSFPLYFQSSSMPTSKNLTTIKKYKSTLMVLSVTHHMTVSSSEIFEWWKSAVIKSGSSVCKALLLCILKAADINVRVRVFFLFHLVWWSNPSCSEGQLMAGYQWVRNYNSGLWDLGCNITNGFRACEGGNSTTRRCLEQELTVLAVWMCSKIWEEIWKFI